MKKLPLVIVVAFALATVATASTAKTVMAVEYFNTRLEHYFTTADPNEVDVLDRLVIAGWERTGLRYQVEDAPTASTSPVCRFFSTAFAGRPTHFLTASATECAYLKANPDWQYEGIAFHVVTPDASGQCADRYAPVMRFFNSGRGGAPNHAFTPHWDHGNALVASGYVYEGVAYCVPSSAWERDAHTAALSDYEIGLWDIDWSGGVLGETVDIVPLTRVPSEDPIARYALEGLGQTYTWMYIQNPYTLQAIAVPAPRNEDALAEAAWDPLTDEYRLVRMRFDAVGLADSVIWTMKLGDPFVTTICAHLAWQTAPVDSTARPTSVHPFQPMLESAPRCFPTLATSQVF